MKDMINAVYTAECRWRCLGPSTLLWVNVCPEKGIFDVKETFQPSAANSLEYSTKLKYCLPKTVLLQLFLPLKINPVNEDIELTDKTT